MNYTGVIIEESLENKSVLDSLKIVGTEVEKVEAEHETPWIAQWTKHSVEIPEEEADAVAEKLSRALDRAHGASWYADFKNDDFHHIIFREKVFRVDRKKKADYDAAEAYGRSLGIPADQLINYGGEYRNDPAKIVS